jgi:membrane-associated protein
MLGLIKKAVDVILHLDKYLGQIVQTYGTWTYLIIFLVIFCETGLVVTPFLPGDSLLFVTGALAGQGMMNIVVLFILLSIAAVLGDSFNYWLGSYFGEKVFAKSRFVKKEYLERTKEFYKKHGGKTIIMARFLPIIRTFAPFVAGVGKMSYFQFLSYNIIGGIAWVTTFLLGGYYFGAIPWVKENLTLVIFTIIFLSLIPPVIEFFKSIKH